MSTAPITLQDEYALDGEEIRIPPSAHALAGFRAWATSENFPQRGHISFINGEILIDMSPEELENHNKVKIEITACIHLLNRKLKRGQFYGDRALVSNEEADLSTEPEACFVSWESLRSGRVRLVPRKDVEGEYMELEGSPDWVLEIVSRYSVRKDTRLLRESYYRAGVSEYWLVDARGEEIDFQILRRGPKGFVPARRKGDWQWSQVFRRWFRLKRQRGQMGLWEYVLQMKK